MCLGIKKCYALEKCRSKAAYLRGGRFSKVVSPQRAHFQLRNDFYKGIVHRSSFLFMVFIFWDAICMLQKVTCKHCQVCAARMYGGSVGLHVREYRPGVNLLCYEAATCFGRALFVGGGWARIESGAILIKRSLTIHRTVDCVQCVEMPIEL